MIVLLLLRKIVSLFLIMAGGFLLVKRQVLAADDSKVISKMCLYLICPCSILSAFQVDYSAEVVEGLKVAFLAAILIHILLIVLNEILKRTVGLNPVEQMSVVYSNAGNLIIPLVTSIFGKEWVIYSSAFLSVQTFLLWSHGKSIICEEKGIDLKKVLTNINMIAVFVGIFLFVTHLRFPGPLGDSVDSMSAMLGPSAMLVIGMCIGNVDLKQTITNSRIWMILVLRLLIVPLVMILAMKVSPLGHMAENGETILLITLLATMTPPASSITNMAQVYGKDAAYASAINVICVLCCIATMPLMVAVYQL